MWRLSSLCLVPIYGLALNTKLYWAEGCTAQESVHSLDLSTPLELVIVESRDVNATLNFTSQKKKIYILMSIPANIFSYW